MQTLPQLFRVLLIVSLWLLLLVPALSAQSDAPFTLTAASLQNGQSVELSKLTWKYQPGDDPAWADPQFDDRAWETLNGTAITLNSIPKSGWHGIGWFRLRLKADPALATQSLALMMVHFGASEIYLDGKLVQNYGRVGTTPEMEIEYNPNLLPLGIALDERREHVLAVRHSCMKLREPTSWMSKWSHRLRSREFSKYMTNHTTEYGAGFGIRVQEQKRAQSENEALKSLGGFGFDLYASGLYFAIGLLHLLLYWFFLHQRAHLFLGMFAWFVSLNTISTNLLKTGHYGAKGLLLLFILNALSFYSVGVSILAYLHTVFSQRLPKKFWLWVLAAAATYFIVEMNILPWAFLIFMALSLVEVLRVLIQAIRNKIDGAWIMGTGLLMSGITGSIVVLYVSIGGPGPFIFRGITAISIIFPPSLLLARRFAHTSRNLEAKLVQVEELSAKELEHQRLEAELRLQHAQEKAENERRAKELEEARQLQLSMLPKTVPQLPHLEIAAYMKTATEVGGDYYDFHLAEDGTLTIAVGDATGHGMRAGTLVASVKSLFVSLAYHPDIPHIFHRMSRVLKEMKLRGLFMAMTMVKIKGDQLTVSIAGMPPLLIYRAAQQQVEEIALKAMPLGGLMKYEYKQQELGLSIGDAVVLMSDGLPERMNAAGEMLDYAATKHAFAEAASHCPQQIIEHFVRVGEEWSNGRLQDDDVTFVVLKIRDRQDGLADAHMGKRLNDN